MQLRQHCTVASAKQPKLPYLHKSSRQDMLHKTVQKCQDWQRTAFWLMTCSVDVAEGHAFIDQANNPLVGERHVKDVGRQILERSCSSSDLPTIH
jgi:hypothetical protein